MVFLCLAAPQPSQASTAPSFKLDYAVRVKGHTVGEASFRIGKRRKRGREMLRPVRFEADIRPAGIAVLSFTGECTSWVADGWTPRESDWNWKELTRRSAVKATAKNGRLNGSWALDGKVRKRIRRKVDGHLSDVISVVPWLMDQELSKGRVLKTTTFTGNQVYEVSAVVGDLESVQLPEGPRIGWSLAFTARRPGKTRRFTIWVDEKTGTPLRLKFDYPLIGHIDAILTGAKKRG